jgi:hypothetical protein
MGFVVDKAAMGQVFCPSISVSFASHPTDCYILINIIIRG